MFHPRAGGPEVAPGSSMRWPSSLPLRSAMRDVVRRRVVVNPQQTDRLLVLT
jgi:hypothetical protein